MEWRLVCAARALIEALLWTRSLRDHRFAMRPAVGGNFNCAVDLGIRLIEQVQIKGNQVINMDMLGPPVGVSVEPNMSVAETVFDKRVAAVIRALAGRVPANGV